MHCRDRSPLPVVQCETPLRVLAAATFPLAFCAHNSPLWHGVLQLGPRPTKHPPPPPPGHVFSCTRKLHEKALSTQGDRVDSRHLRTVRTCGQEILLTDFKVITDDRKRSVGSG